MKTNKEIRDMKLAITTDCILRCKYCFVQKNHRYMDFSTAKKSIDLFLSSPGKEKILRIYGGEPLMHFALIKKIAPYASKKAKDEGKRLTITPCTNAVLLNKQHISFLKRHNLKLAISVDGDKISHNRFRVDNSNEGSFDKIRRNLGRVFRDIDKRNIAAALGVMPSASSRLYKNFRHILDLGFDTVNIEPTYGFQVWTIKARREFMYNMKKIIRYIFSEAKKENFVFLTTINKELKYKTLTNLRKGRCHFFRSFEVYPDGEIAFSSFLFNVLDRGKYIIGNINADIADRYKDCWYSRKSIKCKICVSDYFDHKDRTLSAAALDMRDTISIKAAREITGLTEKSRIFKRYVIEAKEHICF